MVGDVDNGTAAAAAVLVTSAVGDVAIGGEDDVALLLFDNRVGDGAMRRATIGDARLLACCCCCCCIAGLFTAVFVAINFVCGINALRSIED